MGTIQNIHGRKWGRGIRPWLLMPKYFFVSLIIGGLFAVLVIIAALPVVDSPDRARLAWAVIRAVYRYEVVPATAGAVIFGVLLLLQHPREFLQMRWLRVKLILVLLVVPSAHFITSSVMSAVSDTGRSVHLFFPVPLFPLFIFMAIAILGRLKPRLRQPYGRV